jgi:hypothetical protein
VSVKKTKPKLDSAMARQLIHQIDTLKDVVAMNKAMVESEIGEHEEGISTIDNALEVLYERIRLVVPSYLQQR